MYMIARDENETLYRGEKITLVLEKQYKPTFGNQFNVSNTATNLNVNKYWSVTFSENNYSGTKAEIGIWNFDNYAAALAFAVSNEEKLVLQQMENFCIEPRQITLCSMITAPHH